MRSFYAACVALSITPATFADTAIELGDQIIKIKNGNVLLEDEQEDMLFDGKRMIVIDHKARGYFVMDPKVMGDKAKAMQAQMQPQMQQLQQQLGPMMQQMQTLLDNPDIPENQKAGIRAQLERLTAGAGAATASPGAMPKPQPVTVRATGETRAVRNIPCKVVLVSRGSRNVQEACVATRKDAGVPEADYQAMRNMFAFMRKTAEEMMTSMGMQAPGSMFPDFEGVPVEIKDLEDGKVSTLRSVSTKPIDAAAMRIPAGYRQNDPFM